MKKILLLAAAALLAALAVSCNPAQKDEDVVTNTFLYMGKTYNVRITGGVDEATQTYTADINFEGEDTPDWMMFANGRLGTIQLPAKEGDFDLSNNYGSFYFKSGTVKATFKDNRITLILDAIQDNAAPMKLSVRSEPLEL